MNALKSSLVNLFYKDYWYITSIVKPQVPDAYKSMVGQ